jgi:fatty acid desaturase
MGERDMGVQPKEGEKEMSKDIKVRWGWLKFMYIYTIVLAGGCGLGIILVPNVMISVFRMPRQDPIVSGVMGSVFLAFGILSILGLRSPLKFVPILLLQLCYKLIWFVGVILPLRFVGPLPMYGILFVVIFVIYIAGDLIAIPFHYAFAKQ